MPNSLGIDLKTCDQRALFNYLRGHGVQLFKRASDDMFVVRIACYRTRLLFGEPTYNFKAYSELVGETTLGSDVRLERDEAIQLFEKLARQGGVEYFISALPPLLKTLRWLTDHDYHFNPTQAVNALKDSSQKVNVDIPSIVPTDGGGLYVEHQAQPFSLSQVAQMINQGRLIARTKRLAEFVHTVRRPVMLNSPNTLTRRVELGLAIKDSLQACDVHLVFRGFPETAHLKIPYQVDQPDETGVPVINYARDSDKSSIKSFIYLQLKSEKRTPSTVVIPYFKEHKIMAYQRVVQMQADMSLDSLFEQLIRAAFAPFRSSLALALNNGFVIDDVLWQLNGQDVTEAKTIIVRDYEACWEEGQHVIREHTQPRMALSSFKKFVEGRPNYRALSTAYRDYSCLADLGLTLCRRLDAQNDYEYTIRIPCQFTFNSIERLDDRQCLMPPVDSLVLTHQKSVCSAEVSVGTNFLHAQATYINLKNESNRHAFFASAPKLEYEGYVREQYNYILQTLSTCPGYCIDASKLLKQINRGVHIDKARVRVLQLAESTPRFPLFAKRYTVVGTCVGLNALKYYLNTLAPAHSVAPQMSSAAS